MAPLQGVESHALCKRGGGAQVAFRQLRAEAEQSVYILVRRARGINCRQGLVVEFFYPIRLPFLHRTGEYLQQSRSVEMSLRKEPSAVGQPLMRMERPFFVDIPRKERHQPVTLESHPAAVGKPVGMIIHISAPEEKRSVARLFHKGVPFPLPRGRVSFYGEVRHFIKFSGLSYPGHRILLVAVFPHLEMNRALRGIPLFGGHCAEFLPLAHGVADLDGD